MLALTVLLALLAGIGCLGFAARQHDRDEFGPSVRDYAAFRAALGAAREH